MADEEEDDSKETTPIESGANDGDSPLATSEEAPGSTEAPPDVAAENAEPEVLPADNNVEPEVVPADNNVEPEVVPADNNVEPDIVPGDDEELPADNVEPPGDAQVGEGAESVAKSSLLTEGNVDGDPSVAQGDAQSVSVAPSEGVPTLADKAESESKVEPSPEENKTDEAKSQEDVIQSIDLTAEPSEKAKTSSQSSSRKSDIQALTTAQILERLKKSYDQACRTLAVIGSIQRRESILRLEENERELIQKFSKFEGNLEELELVKEQATQTIERRSVGTETTRPAKQQDILPQVVVCGRQERVPRIVVCDATNANQFQLERERLLKTQKELVSKCEFMRQQLMLKETAVGKLQMQICSLRRENYALRKQVPNTDQMQPITGITQSVCPSSCPADCRLNTHQNSNCKSSQEESKLTHGNSVSELKTSDNICSTKCPNFKQNLSTVKENFQTEPTDNIDQQMLSDGLLKHVCPTKCPNFKSNIHSFNDQSHSMENSHIMSGSTDEEAENVEVELDNESLCSCDEMPPHDVPGCVEGENVTENGSNAHIIMRICNNGTERQQTMYELTKERDCLRIDLKNKMVELKALRKSIVEHKEIAEAACVAQQRAEIEVKNLLDKIKTMEDKNLTVLVPKERIIEMEQQIVVAKDRFLEAQDELEDLRELAERQLAQLEDYRSKYLTSHELVEDQKGQIDMLELENTRINENVALEIQRVKNEFELKLQALSPLPEILKTTQDKLQELQQLQDINERRYQDMEKELEEAKAKIKEYARLLDDSITSSNMDVEGRGSMKKKIKKWEERCQALGDENTELRKANAAFEETANNYQIRLTEKLHEVAQLSATMEMLRSESARQVSRAKERLEGVRQSLHTQVLELEEQVAQSRAIARTARKDRDNIRQRMQAQIDSLYENFEQAQVTIRTLQEHIGFFNNSS